MRVLYQPIQDTPGDWLEVDSADWDKLGSFSLNAVCVQGVVFGGADQQSVEVVGNEVRVYIWHDSPIDWPPGTRWARVIKFRPLAPDPVLGGAINTNHSHVLYVEGDREAAVRAQYAGNAKVTFKGWHEFDPRRVAPKAGAWMQDAKYKAHLAAQTPCGWREWNEGLAPSELDANGRVKSQRPRGRFLPNTATRTFILDGSGSAGAVHQFPPESSDQNAMIEDVLQTPVTLVSQNVGGGAEVMRFVWSTEVSVPNEIAWPTGNYRCQLDVSAAGAETTYGLLTQGAGLGHFARINAGLTADVETKCPSPAP